MSDMEQRGPGEAFGTPAEGMDDRSSYDPTGAPPRQNWQESTVADTGLQDRSGIFFAALQMTRMPMVLTDPRLPDNPIVFANRAFLDLTLYEEDEILGRNCRFLQGPDSDRDTVADIAAAICEERAISVDLLNYKRDGTPFWNSIFLAPVHDHDGTLIYFFASQLDISRRYTSEQAFRQAQKMESIGQLTAGLAHDFNNLLQVIAGNLELVLAGDLSDRQRRQLENAARATDRGARLTRQLLAFARKTRLEAKPTNLNRLIRETGEMLENSVGASIRLETSLREDLPTTMIDPVHLEMALMNVLINARDASPKGGTVTVATGTEEIDKRSAGHNLRPGTYVVLSIQDQGEGMPPEIARRAVEPFFTTKGADKGTGLGLAMVHGFVQQSLGKLEIRSEAGRGTTIRMLFPVAEQPAPSRPASEHPVLGGANGTVLVVEDNDDVRALAEDHLTALGYSVFAASSGEQALEVLDTLPAPPDLLFTDIVMPGGMSGLELAAAVHRRHPGMPVLLTTGYNEELAADMPRDGSLDVLGKPYRRAELADRVRQAIEARHEGPRRTPTAFGAAEA